MRLSWLIIACTVLVACGAPAPKMPTIRGFSQVMVQNPTWSFPGREIEAAQLLSGQNGNQSYTFQARISISKTELHLLAIDTFGRRAMEINWGQNGLRTSRADWLPETVLSEDVLKHIMLVYWPTRDVTSQLLSNYAIMDDKKHQRRVVSNGKDIITITYASNRENAWSETTIFEDQRLKQQLTIQSSEITNE